MSKLLSSIIGKILSLTVLFSLCFPAVFAVDSTQIGMVNVTASVLGDKPMVTLVAPISGTNDGATVMTKIVGYNFTGAYGVSLDDNASTVLSGVITITDDCDSNGDNCGGGGSYQKITGLSVPAGVNQGVYNVLVTSAAGTNLISDTKFTMNAPAATATPSISAVTPHYISAMADLNDAFTVAFTINDSDSAAVDFDAANLTVGGTTVDNYLPVTQETSAANAAGGENVSFRFNSNSAGEAYGTLDIRAGDGGTSTIGNTSTKTIDIFIEPSW